jgi:bacteriocin-like protein
MKTLEKNELMEINGGIDQAAYNAGHAAGDFAQIVVRGVFLLGTIFLRAIV